MKKALTSPVQIWQLLLVCVLAAALTGTVVVSAAPFASSFLPQGTIRMTAASQSASVQISVPAGQTKNVLSQAITIPAGKVADIAAIGETNIEGGAPGNTYCYGQYRLDDHLLGPQFKPGQYILLGDNPTPNNISLPIDGILTNVHAGTHTVYLDIGASFSACIVQWRTMILIANIH